MGLPEDLRTSTRRAVLVCSRWSRVEPITRTFRSVHCDSEETQQLIQMVLLIG